MAATCAAFATAPVCAVKAAPARKQATFNGLARVTLKKAETTFEQCTVSNGIKTRQMLVWQPTDNKYFETLSYLPPLSDDDISKQIEYIIRNGWIPALEFAEAADAYATPYGNGSTIRMNVSSGFYDNRYWTLYKLPMFGCTDPSQVLGEIKNATKAFPDAYVRLVAFDNVKQVQMLGMLVHRPPSATDYRPIDKRNA